MVRISHLSPFFIPSFLNPITEKMLREAAAFEVSVTNQSPEQETEEEANKRQKTLTTEEKTQLR